MTDNYVTSAAYHATVEHFEDIIGKMADEMSEMYDTIAKLTQEVEYWEEIAGSLAKEIPQYRQYKREVKGIDWR